MFNSKLSKQEQGFTLTEVLVAILITSVFVATAMQAVVIAAVMRVKAKQSAEAITWIQQDLENVRYQANQLDYNNTTSQYNPDSTRCSATTSITGYGDKLRDIVAGRDITTASNNVDLLKTSSSGKTYNLRRTTTPSSLSNSVPYNNLQLSYTVNPTSGGSDIAILYAEIIPDVAFKCP